MTTLTTPPSTITTTGRVIKPKAWSTELHTRVTQEKMAVSPRVDSREPARGASREVNSRRMMGSPMTNRPTPMGKDSRAAMRRAEPDTRLAPRRSRRARAPDTAGITEAVRAAMRAVGRL